MTENQEQLTAIINEIYDAVDGSKAGPICYQEDDGKEWIINPAGIETYKVVLSIILSHRQTLASGEPWEDMDDNSYENDNDWDGQ